MCVLQHEGASYKIARSCFPAQMKTPVRICDIRNGSADTLTRRTIGVECQGVLSNYTLVMIDIMHHLDLLLSFGVDAKPTHAFGIEAWAVVGLDAAGQLEC